MVRHHFAPCPTQIDAFRRLRSVQFDPIAPIGCNHDLVLQARVPGYRVGDWEKTAYQERLVYDGWDKQASLVPFEGWPLRRIYHYWHGPRFHRLFEEYSAAVEAILSDLEERGPLLPSECGFQEKRADWKGTWHSSNVTKRVLQALWHSGKVMTAGRRKGQHLYDLTERIVPPAIYAQPMPAVDDAIRELVLERHRAVGLLRLSAPPEVWSYKVKAPSRDAAISKLTDQGEVVAVDVEGVAAHATPAFLSLLDQPSLEPRVLFVAPLDQIMWDRKMVAHLFGFDYAWEIYIPEAKRRWGYYVLPVLYGDAMVARAELWCRKGTLEIRRWLFERNDIDAEFWPELEQALRLLMNYCSATSVASASEVDSRVRELAAAL